MSITVKTKSANLTYVDKGIVKAFINEGCTLDQSLAIENFIAVDKLLEGRKYACIIDERADYVTETEDAFEFNTSEKVTKTRVASAYLIKSPLKKIVNNIKLKLSKSESCVKFFTDEQEAMDWIKFKMNENTGSNSIINKN